MTQDTLHTELVQTFWKRQDFADCNGNIILQKPITLPALNVRGESNKT